MAVNSDGYIGEQRAMSLFRAKGIRCFQPDLIAYDRHFGFFVVEVKYQAAFEPPPFRGHGLPSWQVKARLNFYRMTGIRCLFLVFDKNDRDVYFNWLDLLDAGEKFLTASSDRVIYGLDAFKKMDISA